MSTQRPYAGLSRRRSDPESFRARSLSASLTVRDLQASVDWYHHAIGFVVDETWDDADGRTIGVLIKAGSVRIMLNQDDGAKGADREKGIGFSLHFTTVQDVDQIAERVMAEGSVLESSPADTPWGTRAFRVRDPDGFILAISSEPTSE